MPPVLAQGLLYHAVRFQPQQRVVACLQHYLGCYEAFQEGHSHWITVPLSHGAGSVVPVAGLLAQCNLDSRKLVWLPHGVGIGIRQCCQCCRVCWGLCGSALVDGGEGSRQAGFTQTWCLCLKAMAASQKSVCTKHRNVHAHFAVSCAHETRKSARTISASNFEKCSFPCVLEEFTKCRHALFPKKCVHNLLVFRIGGAAFVQACELLSGRRRVRYEFGWLLFRDLSSEFR